MALPSPPYAVAEVSNPSSSLTDFTLLVDLSRLPQSWWDEVDTTDPTKGRAARDSDGLELAADWIEFDTGAQTGWARVLWTGTLSTAGSETLRIYPPQAANSSVAAGDTFGQYAAYDADWWGYWPEGGGIDRTSGRSATASSDGGTPPTVGGGSGPLGPATQFDGVDDYIVLGDGAGAVVTALAWAKQDDTSGDAAVIGSDGSGGGPPVQVWRDEFSSPDRYGLAIRESHGTFRVAYDVGNDPGTDWHQVGFSWNDVDTGVLLVDGQNAGEASASAMTPSTPALWLGANISGSTYEKFLNGLVQEAQIHSAIRSDAWIEHEYSQTSDQAAFWGTWSVEAETTSVSVQASGTSSLTGLFSRVDQDVYFDLPGAVGDYVSTPDDASLRITGDIDVRGRILPDDWNADLKTIVAKDSNTGSPDRAWLFVQYNGGLRFAWSPNGDENEFLGHDSVAITPPDEGPLWVRVTLDVDNGSGGYDLRFWTSDNGDTWTQLGTTFTGGEPTQLPEGLADLTIGARTSGNDMLFVGDIYRIMIFDGFGGTPLVDVSGADALGDGSTFEALSGQTFTIHGNVTVEEGNLHALVDNLAGVSSVSASSVLNIPVIQTLSGGSQTLASASLTIPLVEGMSASSTSSAVLTSAFHTPLNLQATVVGDTQIDLSWDQVNGADGYDVERDGVIIASGITGTGLSDTGLNSGTEYSYRVRARRGF